MRYVACARGGANVITLAKSLCEASPAERVSLIRNGVPISQITDLSEAMHVSRERLMKLLNMPKGLFRRKDCQEATLSAELSERVIGLLRLIGQVAAIVDESGSPQQFDAARWMGEWLEQPVLALQGGTPGDYMDTLTGQALVSSLLLQSQAGVFG